jgi:hypothetical protein
MHICNFFLEYLDEERASKFEDTNNIQFKCEKAVFQCQSSFVCSSQTYIARSDGWLLQKNALCIHNSVAMVAYHSLFDSLIFQIPGLCDCSNN